MSNQKGESLEDRMWLFGIIITLMIFIGIWLPAVYTQSFGANMFLWKSGFYIDSNSSGFLSIELSGDNQTLIIAGGVFSLLFTSVACFIMLVSSYKAKEKFYYQGRTWMGIGIFLIASELIWMGFMSAVSYSIAGNTFEFWDEFQIGAGVIFGIISGALALGFGFLGELIRS